MSLFDGKFCEQDEDDVMSLTQVNELIAKLQSDKARLIEALEVAYCYCPDNESFDYIGYLISEMKGL
jgi:hypothetical protein